MENVFKCRRGGTTCLEIENGEWNRCSFVLPTKIDCSRVGSERVIINFYAKEIELKIGDIIHSYWGEAFKVIGGDRYGVTLEVEKIKED